MSAKYHFSEKQMTYWVAQQEAARTMLVALEGMHQAFNAKKPIPKQKGDALEAMCCAAIAQAKEAGIKP